MEFHEYRDHYTNMKQQSKRQGFQTPDLQTCYDNFEQVAKQNMQDDSAITGMLLCEISWWNSGREYYNVYPAISQVMAELKMDDLPFKSLFKDRDRTIAIQFAKGHEVDGVDSLIITTHPAARGLGYGLSICTNADGDGHRSIFGARMDTHKDQPLGVVCSQAHDKFVRIALATLLLDRDPEFLQPHLLSKDAGKWQWADEEHRAALCKKAEKTRGRRGFLVGAKMETVPHIRRPHMARRWYGKGRKKLKFVMVKGSIVHREKVVQVPTGRASDD